MARSCNVATDRLVYQDVSGLSATEPCPRGWIWASTKPKDAGLICEVGPIGSWAMSGASRWQAQSRRVAQTLARAKCAGPVRSRQERI